MSSLQPLREFISERLSAAAEEICKHFEGTVVLYEKELDRYRKLLENRPNQHAAQPETTLPQHYSIAEGSHCEQERNTSVKNEEPEVSPIKTEQDVFCITHSEEQLHPKSETDIAMVTPANDKTENIDVDLDSKQFLILSFHGTNSESREESKLTSKDQEVRNHENALVRNPSSGTAILGSVCPRRNKPFSCKECDKSYDRKSCLRRHMLVHTGERRFSCKECKKRFRLGSHLTAHMKTHSGQKPFSCKECQKSFKEKHRLVIHMRSHTGEKPYSCKQCEKHFTDAGALSKHMKIHLGEKPFACTVCGKSFARASLVSSHMLVHTGEKPFRCKVCQKGFIQKHRLIVHIRSHTGEKPYPCKLCDKSFTEKCYLSKHLKTHSGERPFSCRVCGKRFVRSTNLSAHMTIHTGKKPFPCKLCGKGFSSRSRFSIHMRSHMGETFVMDECGSSLDEN